MPYKAAKFRMKIKFPKNLDIHIVDAIVKAISAYNSIIYPIIIAQTPVYKGPYDPKRKSGIIQRNLKLTTRQVLGRTYITFGVEGGSLPGTEAYHAARAIDALHFGWARPFRRPKTGVKRMVFPVADKWIYTWKVSQPAVYKKNAWIPKVFFSRIPVLNSLLDKYLGIGCKKANKGMKRL